MRSLTLAAVAATALAAGMATPAVARTHVSLFIGSGYGYYPPPVYYPRPVYYAPAYWGPPVYGYYGGYGYRYGGNHWRHRGWGYRGWHDRGWHRGWGHRGWRHGDDDDD